MTTARQWRLPVAIAAIVLLGGALIAWLQPPARPSGYLDPRSTDPSGGHALATILAQRGEQVTAVTTAAAAATAAASGSDSDSDSDSHGPATILVTNPELLTAAQLSGLRNSAADIVLADPDRTSLATLAPGVTVARQSPVAALNPGCALSAATLAGSADLGGTLLTTTVPGAQLCYPADGHPSLIRFRTGVRQITVLGTGAALTNQDLGDRGNAALVMNLLGGQPRLIWLTPAAAPTGPPAAGQTSFTSLIPEPVYMVTAQLLIAVALLALWRIRRLGPVVAERLPAVVRASETTEGHGRLYHARRSRDRAAQALRDAAIARLLPKLGLPPDAARNASPDLVADLVAATLAQRTGDPAVSDLPGPSAAADIARILAGPPPEDDAALIALADRLDELERKAGAR